jgi:hypothetical protein
MVRTGILDMMIVGAHKAGTSTLLRYLGAHPGIRAQIWHEMTYFVEPHLYRRDLAEYRDWYFGRPDQPSDRNLIQIGKLAGLMYQPQGLDRLRQHNPNVQVAAILRDPVRRAYSAFWFARLEGREPLASFEEALRGDDARFGTDHRSRRTCAYLDRSLYAQHIRRLFEWFGHDRVHVLILEEFHQNSVMAVEPLLRSFDLDPSSLPALAERENTSRRPRSFRFARLLHSQSGATLAMKRMLPRGARDAIRHCQRRFNEVPWSPPPIDAALEHELRTYFAGPNRDLEQLLDRELSGLWPGPTG